MDPSPRRFGKILSTASQNHPLYQAMVRTKASKSHEDMYTRRNTAFPICSDHVQHIKYSKRPIFDGWDSIFESCPDCGCRGIMSLGRARMLVEDEVEVAQLYFYAKL